MGVITQKDIVKIINSSVDNIQVIIDTLTKNISKVTKSTNTATLKNNLNLITEIEKFISEYVKIMDVITNTLPKLKFSKLQSRMALNSINNIMGVILKFVNSLTDEAFNKFNPKQLLDRLKDIKNIVISVEELFKSTSSMVKHSLVIILFGWMVKLSMHIIIGIVNTIIKLSNLSISKDTEKAFMRLKNIFDGIYDISKMLVKLIPLSIIATVGAIVTAIFVLELCAFVLVIGLLSKTMRFISGKVIKGIKRLSEVFKALIWVSVWILILAIVAPAVSASLLIVINLVLILMLSVAILAVALFLTSKLARFARNQAIKIAWNIILITGIFVIMCLAIVLAGVAGKILLEDGAISKIVVGLIGISVMLSLFIVIGKIMGKAEKYLASLKISLLPLLGILGLIALIMVEMVALALFGGLLMQGNNIINIIFGLSAIIIVGVIVTLLGMLLSKAVQYLVIAQASIIPLITILGLLVLVGVALVAFAAVGVFVKENIGNIIFGLLAIIIVAGLIVALGMALMAAMPLIAVSISAAIPLIIVFGLLVVAGLSIVMFGKIGQYLEKNILYVLGGFAAITAVAIAMIGLGVVLTSALPFMLLTLAVAMIYAAAIGMLIVIELAINKFGEIDLSAIQNVVLGNIGSITSIGYALSELGIALIPIAVGCTLLLALITPLLGAVLLVALVVKSIEIISKVKINNKSVDTNIRSISLFWKSVKTLLDTFKPKDLFLFNFTLIVCVSIAAITLTIESIVKRLQKIANIELDDATILGNVEKIFNCVTNLATKIEELLTGPAGNSPLFEVPESGFFSLFKKKKPSTKNKLDNVKTILATLTGITSGLNEIQKFTLQEDAITNNVNNIFNFISKLNDHINGNLTKITAFDDNVIENSTWWGGTKTHTEKNDSFKRLDNVSQVITILGSICTALNSMQKITINESKIRSNVDYIFGFITDLYTHIKNNMSGLSAFEDSLGGQSIDTNNLDIIVNGINTLTDTIQKLNDVKIDGFKTNSKNIIDFLVNLSNVELDMDRAFGINKSLNAITAFISNYDINIEKAQKKIDFMDRLNTVVKSLGEVTPEQVNRSKEMIKAQIAYLDKVNGIDIVKLKTSSRMIESMAKLSASIRGNFEGLAESINEDLMPVLQELKEIMEKIPEKLDTGFQNTSASIGASFGLGSNMNVDAMSEQVKRENPELTPEQVKQIADQRIRQYARTQSGAKTITDLYNLFSGQKGTAVVKLKTSN